MKLSRTLLVTALLTCGLSMAAIAPAVASDVSFAFRMKASGTPSFDADNSPGNDTDDTNNIIRTQDIITYEWEYGVNNGAANNVVLHATVPANVELTLPPVCSGAGSGLTVNSTTGEQTIDCNLGTLPSGSAGKIDLKARVLGQERVTNKFVAQGDKTDAKGSLTADNNNTPSGVIQATQLNISARPKADLIKDSAYAAESALGTDGVTQGVVIRYPITVAITGGGKGSEALIGPINFTDTLTYRDGPKAGQTIPGARLFDWRSGYTSITPGSTSGCNRMGGDYWAYYGGYPNGKVNSSIYPQYAVPEWSTQDSGTWTCSQAGAGAPIQINITGADTTGNHAPSRDYYGGTVLAADKTYLVVGTINLWVPAKDIVDAGGQLNVRNTVSGFAIKGASGAPNVEPTLANNQYDHTLVATGGSFTSYYAKNVDERGTPPPGMSNIYGGDGPVMPGQIVTDRVYLANSGVLPWEIGATLCTAIDNETQTLTPLTPGSTSAVKDFPTGGVALGVDYVIEYGTGTFATPADQKKATCTDAESTTGWSTTLPSNPEKVNRVRVRAIKPIPANGVFDIALNLTVRNTFLTSGAKVPIGTTLVEDSSFYIKDYPYVSQGTAGMAAGWTGGYYDPVSHANVSWGDRLTLTRAVVRVDKQNVPNQPVVNALAGSQVSFILKPTITAPISASVASPVILKDILPKTLDYVVGSANIPPTSIVNNPDGTKLLTWDLGSTVPGQPLPEINYKASVRLDAPNNATATNTAIIESPDDGTLEQYRTDKVDVNIGNAAAFQIFKEVDKVLIDPNSAINYRLFYANTGGSDVGTSQFIDVLPHIGDGRIPATNFVGAFNFNTIAGTNGETFEYTNRPYNQVNPDPNDASNQSGATKWCTPVQVGSAGCPGTTADVTAIRINAPAFPKNTPTRVLNLNMLTNGNSEDNFYTNRFSGRATGLLAFLNSNDVFTKVKVPARLLLVKRITAINGVPINTVVDDPNTNSDNHPAWPVGYLKGAIDGGVVKPNDDVEYTIYYLSSGDYPVTNGKFCDRVPTETSFFAKGYNGQTPVASGATPGADLGIRFDKANLTEYLTGDLDGDKGTFFPQGVTPTNITCSGPNTNGAVTVNLGTIPQSGYGASTPNNAYGFVRFKSKVK